MRSAPFRTERFAGREVGTRGKTQHACVVRLKYSRSVAGRHGVSVMDYRVSVMDYQATECRSADEEPLGRGRTFDSGFYPTQLVTY